MPHDQAACVHHRSQRPINEDRKLPVNLLRGHNGHPLCIFPGRVQLNCAVYLSYALNAQSHLSSLDSTLLIA